MLDYAPEEDLCWYDPRNPSFNCDARGQLLPRLEYCGCNACNCGRDRLAVEIIRLRDEAAPRWIAVDERLPADREQWLFPDGEWWIW